MNKEMKKQNILWLVLFVLGLALMLWKLPYGFGGDDEGFYLTIANRLTLGERLFTDEWHLSQLSSFFLFPFVFLYKSVIGGTDGILFASRWLYLVCHAAASAVVYHRLKKYGALSVLGSIFFLLFTPFDMMTCSYNTIALDALALCGAFAASYEKDTDMVLSGVFLAGAVVCCPYLAAAFFLYALLVGMYRLAYQKTGKEFFAFKSFSPTALGLVTLGAGIVFVLFLVFLLTHTSIQEIVKSLPGLFSDPEHPKDSVIFKLKHYVYCIITGNPYTVIPLGLYALTLAAMLFDKKRKKRSLLYIALSSAVTVLWLCLFIPELMEKNFNSILVPLTPLGLAAYILTEKKPRALFDFVFLLGITYSVCVCATSNMGFDILAIGFSVVNIANCIFIGLFLRESAGTERRKAFTAVCFVSVALLGVLLLTVKIDHCFWDASPAELHAKLEQGPGKGIVTNEFFQFSYNDICEDMREYIGQDGNILIYSQQCWEYLIPEMPYASFSAWLSGMDEKTDERLALYYEMNPENAPDFIYIPKTSAFGELNIPAEQIYADAEKYGFSVTESGISYKLSR